MKPPLIFLFGVIGVIFAGCATPFRAPPDVANIELVRFDSPLVSVEKIWLERKNGPLVVTGCVLKRLSADDTTKTHLDHRALKTAQQFFPHRQLHD